MNWNKFSVTNELFTYMGVSEFVAKGGRWARQPLAGTKIHTAARDTLNLLAL